MRDYLHQYTSVMDRGDESEGMNNFIKTVDTLLAGQVNTSGYLQFLFIHSYSMYLIMFLLLLKYVVRILRIADAYHECKKNLYLDMHQLTGYCGEGL